MASTHLLRSQLSSLRARIILLVVIALLPAFGLLIYTGLEQRRNDQAAVRAEALRLTQVVASQQNAVIQNSEGMLAALAGLTAGANLDEVDATQCGTVFSSILKQFAAFENLGLVRSNGDVVCAAIPIEGQVNVSDRLYFQRATKGGEFAVGDYEFNPGTRLSSLNFGYPVLDDTGQTKAVYFASLDLDWLSQLVSAVNLPEGAVISIIDRKGTVVARFPDNDRVGQNVSDSPLGRAILAQEQGVSQLPGLDGQERLYAFAPLSDSADATAYVSIGLSTSHAFADANGTLARNLALLGAVALLAFGAAWFGGDWFFLRPVSALSGAAKRLASGDLQARAGQATGGGELADLARAFDEMAQALEEKETARRHAADALTKNITELGRSNAELEAFTYSVSHDLKEPLRTLEAFSGFLTEDYGDRLDDQGKEYLSKLGKASARMKHLIENLLALSRISRLAEPPAPTDVRRIVSAVVEGMRATLNERHASVEVADDIPRVLADSTRIEQIFGNLISNGIKFNQSDAPRVTIGVRGIENGQVVLYVRDNGIGIDRQYHERIFGIFQRLHRREEYEGTGAGLAIVQRSVESLGGRVWVESKPGAGTTFLFTLPLAAGESGAERVAA